MHTVTFFTNISSLSDNERFSTQSFLSRIFNAKHHVASRG